MNDNQKGVAPYKLLGARLKRLREKQQESLAEVSGAVEIDLELLTRYERGETRPDEEILLLLISHFNIRDEEATKLWKLAGYDSQDMPLNDEENAKPVLVLPADARVQYTDMVHVMVNNYGVVINFMQGGGPGGQPLIVSRLGMSKEHARSIIDVLQKSLEQSEPKSLPSPKSSKKDSSKKSDQE